MMVGAELNFAPSTDDDGTTDDYNRPQFGVGVMLSLNHGVTMRRTPDAAWGQAEMVDYDSRLGNMATLYGSFLRPILRQGRWQVDYTLRTGIRG